MTYDVIIRGGEIVDGTGSEPRRADLAIQGDRIAAIDDVSGDAALTIDATGKIVTPGFVDLHAHMDAQVMWDPKASPPCYHGITTMLNGNCGLSLAPVRPDEAGVLVKLLEFVEDIPAEAILEGNRFTGGSFGAYLDTLESLPMGINVASLVGHTAVRYLAMGERSMDESADPNDAELSMMCEAVRGAMNDGAFGFSTSRSLVHSTSDGRKVPGTFANLDELMAFGKVIKEAGHGIYGWVSAIESGDAEPQQRDVEMMRRISSETGCAFTFAVVQIRDNPKLYRELLDQIAAANAEGAKLRPQTEVRAVGVVVGLQNVTPFQQSLEWMALGKLDIEERLAALRDPERRAALARDGNASTSEAQLSQIHQLVVEDGNARYDFSEDDSLWAIAKRRGVTPADAFIDIVLETDGQACFIFPFANYDIEVVGQMLDDPDMMLGLADSGAHVGQICDTSFSTFFLRYWIHERGLMSLGRGIQKLTSEPAEFLGIRDRGVLREGAFADINVIDLDELRVHLPKYTGDLPAGAYRFIQKASGYDYTLVNGRVFMKDGEFQGESAGVVLRSS
ncbi:MAG: amidohydrolase family protein [bacterium]|jgi:N-acyl-D-aspartate/D-glutamate deacylase|nr:amidohydrolase [Deltaproteobacteria bacterium]MCP4245212.1 amidohydrolase family protein [bacterium]MDP7300515.1 amidohydrolase family protein [Myxococcota bacterium]HJO24729.1 amidohydrolase family protein [Myxococcota bacterium]